MAFVLRDFVQETSVTTGTSDFDLAGAVTNYIQFGDFMSDGDTTFYSAKLGAAWETGIGTYVLASNRLQRTTVLSSSSGGTTKVTFAAGTKTVICGLPAGAVATAAQFRANTPGFWLTTDKVWSAADYVALTDAATVAVDMSIGFNFSLTLGGNRTLGNPSNTQNGQSGMIVITQDGTGSRTLAYGSNWKFTAGTAPTLTTTAGATDILVYQVISSTFILATLVSDVK